MPPLEEVARRWPEIEPVLRRATKITGCYQPVDVLRAVCAGQMALWLIEIGDWLAAIAVTEMRQYPRRRVLEVPFIAGELMACWYGELLRELTGHARRLGCGHIAGSGRRGWTKFGFEDAGAILVRNVE